MSDPWENLAAHYGTIKERRILSLFDDAARFTRFSAHAGDLLLDFSKTNLDETGLGLLLDLARTRGVETRRDAMFRGEKINTSEDRAVLHTALRAGEDAAVSLDGQDVMPDIRATRARMAAFAQGVRSGAIETAVGGRFSDVVNIGIGGSDLGPSMTTLALAPYHDGPRTHFVSNVDPADISGVLAGLDPAETLVIIASKTFTTIETMSNAATALAWLHKGLGDKAPRHLAAVSSAGDKTTELGIDPARVFGFGDWVGGRYSVWGPVGLPLMLAIGPARFDTFLAGARAMDRHFCDTELAENLPVLLGLTGIWHRNICGYDSRAVLPYDQNLRRLPAYLQQLDMESNGKRVGLDGAPLTRASGPIIWGEPGTNGQHAFYQMLHQGTTIVPCEFLIAAAGHHPDLAHQHDLLKANCLAQSVALMRGRMGQGDSYRDFPGNRPSITLAYPKLTPFTLGQIIALYEHRVFVEGAIWGLNSFDQWGVELGKELAQTLLPMVKGADPKGKDSSTRGLLKALNPDR
ncbi:MAG: glucose-6-phosphate isomerase [Alphaproteobacteria bacterium]|nr:glucose-6-phosphate isomerase [Alphaproteobacteria bacterium]